MKNTFSILFFLVFCLNVNAQTHPAITVWLQNTTETGSYYVAGNSNLIENNILVNCQKVEYTDDFVYVSTKGIPEYPDGTYAYFATVDENWNSAYPYVVGPTFYGVRENRKVTSINEPTTVYDGTTDVSEAEFNRLDISVFPNPAADLIAVQIRDLVTENFNVELVDTTGKVVLSSMIKKGSTIAYFDTQTVYAGVYFVRISNGDNQMTRKVMISK